MTGKDRIYIEEISDIIGVSVNTIQRKSWRDKVGIPINKIGKELISFRPILDKWIEKRFNG